MLARWQAVSAVPLHRAAFHTSALTRNKPTDKPQESRQKEEPKPPSKSSQSVLERDREVHERLSDREGGNHAVGIIDGQYEGGLGKETKKNMFRLI